MPSESGFHTLAVESAACSREGGFQMPEDEPVFFREGGGFQTDESVFRPPPPPHPPPLTMSLSGSTICPGSIPGLAFPGTCSHSPSSQMQILSSLLRKGVRGELK